MSRLSSGKNKEAEINGKLAEDFRNLSHQIMERANRGIPKVEFLQEILRTLAEFCGCDRVELWFREGDGYAHCAIDRQVNYAFVYETTGRKDYGEGVSAPIFKDSSAINQLRAGVIRKRFDTSLGFFTRNGSFRTGNITADLVTALGSEKEGDYQNLGIDANIRSLLLVPLVVGGDFLGLMEFRSCEEDFFTEYEAKHFEITAETLGVTIINERAQAALRERVKELSCLYSIAQVVESKGNSLAGILNGIADLLPPAWQYPEITAGRITLDGQGYSTPGFRSGRQRQEAEIVINGRRRGLVEVVYLEDKPGLDEGPFLKEERNLIDAIAGQIALIVERREAEEESLKLQEQLRHADRLATLGQLAAGVAHEINEPLGSILGFAQLLKKAPKLPEKALKDVSRIEDASLHVREVVKKLMLFARQMPPRKAGISLNKLIEEGLYFLKARCRKSGIKINLLLDADLPDIAADQSQIYQVLVNLAVNAMQAMPKGGQLTIKTALKGPFVSLTVQDTGTGMDEETKKKIFMPFFTTKDIGEGTGIGLSVVHGIVTSHGGAISFESDIGKGSSFEVQLPVIEIAQ